MPLRCEVFIVATIFVGNCHLWEDGREESSSGYKNSLPFVPGCRVSEREDNFGLSVFCNSFDVPKTSLSLPDNTISLQIYGVYDLDVDRPLLKRLFKLRELQLPGNRLKKFSSRILEGLSGLLSLDLSNNFMKSLPNDTFVHNPLLEKIDLSKNWVFSLEAVTHCLRELANFRELKLEENLGVSSLTFSDFAPLRNTSFQSLNVASCAIDQIDENAFESVGNLSVLDLSWTLVDSEGLLNITKSLKFSSLRTLKLSNLRRLASFPLKFLSSLSMSPVEELELSSNRFVNFRFDGSYPNLTYLDVTACGLTDSFFDSGLSTAAPNLQKLILKRNKFLKVTKLAHLTKLKHLDMSMPLITDVAFTFVVGDYSFENLVSLEYLSLEGSPIRQGIKRFSFSGLSRLIRLRLNRCVIRFVEEYAFETLQNLEMLDLSYNLITDLDSNTFYGLKNVRTIHLQENIVTSLNKSKVFLHTPALESLILSGNKISLLSPGIFDGLFNLGVIQLDNNFVIPWHKRIFPQNVSISALGIGRNRISYFSAEMLDDVRQLKSLNFEYNPLNCSVCGMKDLQSWMQNTSTDIYDSRRSYSELSPYACMEPPELENVSILEAEIPISHCTPKTLDVVFLSLSTVIPFLTCVLVATAVWHFFSWHIKYCCFKMKSRVRSYKQVTKSDMYTYDAFVSYSPSDILWIRNHLVPALESGDHRYRLCVPDRDFQASINITDNVFDAVKNSRTTMLVLTNSYLESEWCKFDMNIAHHKLFEDTRSLILILLEEVDSEKMTKNLKYIIKTRTFIPWTNNSVGQKLFWERLRNAVARTNEKVLSKHIT